MLETKSYKIKNLNVDMKQDRAVFTGYSSIFDIVDHGGDVVTRTAFNKTLGDRGDKPMRLLFVHYSEKPIGSAKVSTDQYGLKYEAELDLSTNSQGAWYVPDAALVYAMMKRGVMNEMSIGYRVAPGGEEIKNGIRYLKELKLSEISVVPEGMCPNTSAELKNNDVINALLGEIKRLTAAIQGAGFPTPHYGPSKNTHGELIADIYRKLKKI